MDLCMLRYGVVLIVRLPIISVIYPTDYFPLKKKSSYLIRYLIKKSP